MGRTIIRPLQAYYDVKILGTNVPSTVVLGSQLSIDVIVQNVSTSPTSILNTEVKYGVHTGGVLAYLQSDQGIVAIPAGGAAVFTFTFISPTVVAGAYPPVPITEFGLEIIADADGSMPDSIYYTIVGSSAPTTGIDLGEITNLMITMMIVMMMMKMVVGVAK